jgi:hypothetical protein
MITTGKLFIFKFRKKYYNNIELPVFLGGTDEEQKKYL